MSRYYFKQRRGTAALWTSTNPVLLEGEFGIETDTGKFKVGDGSTAWNSLSYAPGQIWDYQIQDGIVRIRHSFANFLGNSGFESWSAGPATYPDNWFFAGGDVIPARAANPTQGTYCCQLTLNSVTPSAVSGMANSWGYLGQYVSYTASMYYKKISGVGGAALMLMMGESPWTVFDICYFDNAIDGQWKLAMATFTVPVSANGKVSFFKIGATDTGESVWLIDECKLEESNALASAWTASPVWDCFDQKIFGAKQFYEDVDISAIAAKGVLLKNSAGTITKRVRLNDTGDGLIFEAP